MAKGRPRTPTNVLDARGTFQKNPQLRRDRENEPQSTKPVGKAPGHLSKEQKKCWAEIVKIAAPGVLTEMDRLQVEAAAIILAQLREPKIVIEGEVIELDAPMFQKDVMASLHKALSNLGMTPVDRSKVQVPKEPESDPLADF